MPQTFLTEVCNRHKTSLDCMFNSAGTQLFLNIYIFELCKHFGPLDEMSQAVYCIVEYSIYLKVIHCV